jgi:hypothetical protein
VTEANHRADLPNCPFETVIELGDACQRKQAFIEVQYGQATSRAMSRGGGLALFTAIGVGAWLWIPVLVIVYAAVARSWFVLLGIPVALVFYNLGFPLAHFFVGAFRLMAFVAAAAVLAVAAVRGDPVLAALAAAAVVAWLANFVATHVAVAAFRREALADGRLLSDLWGRNQLRIRLATGETYTIGGRRDSSGQFHANPPPREV